MSVNILRADDVWYVEREGSAVRVATDAATTAELLADRGAVERAAREPLTDDSPRARDLALQSPVTTPCRLVAQMVNYRSHARESGFDPAQVQPTFFRKASHSISGPTDRIRRPDHVRLLDYEIELGLVFGAPLPVGTTVTAESLPHYVAGLVIANDVSARDVQLSKGQFYESKSYPTFTPVGPRLVLLDAAEMRRLVDLRLQLWVNGSLRQDRTVADMIVEPPAALTALARFQPMQAGDVLLTGTPGGTALQAPPHVVELVGALLHPAVKWKVFFGKQEKVPEYLQAGDLITATIATGDDRINLGSQATIVAGAS